VQHRHHQYRHWLVEVQQRAQLGISQQLCAMTQVGVDRDGLSNQVAPEGIRVNSVSPGIIATDMAAAVPWAKEVAAGSPLGRMGRPDEVAATVSWLISPAASFITGSDITVSGGR
jgi:enoyl-[acyl-carrier-protein] reductase (NADH)